MPLDKFLRRAASIRPRPESRRPGSSPWAGAAESRSAERRL